jgi:phosphohistidine phosphatase SixA
MSRSLRPTRRAALRTLAPALLTLVLGAAPAAGQAAGQAPAASAATTGGTTLVVLVRHAEKAAAPADDPPLDSAGTARAQALRLALADAGIQHVLATPRRRTSDTAAPLARALGLTPELVPLTAGASHVAAVADAVRRQAGRVVLVVGHSNTIPAIVGALGGPKLPDLCDAQYAQLFVLALPASGPARLVRSQYGTPDAPGADRCGAPAPAMR